MPRVLVVDDSDVDRNVIQGILQKDPDLKLGLVGSADEALRYLADMDWDIVVADLVMPGKTGLQLVGEVRLRHPAVPVILTTSQGSETDAVEALRRGAATYVPKKMLAAKLLSTVHEVLALNTVKRVHERLIESLMEVSHRFVIENDPTLIESLVAHLVGLLREMRLFDLSERQRIGMALKEAMANALYHGNLRLGPKLREQMGEIDLAEVLERAKQPQFKDRRVTVDAKFTRAMATFCVRDNGAGFDVSTLPDPKNAKSIEQAQGRGTILMRTFMDEVLYNDAGNEVTMVKRRQL